MATKNRKRAVALSSKRPSPGQIDWNKVIKRAKEIVISYDTPVTLRQLFYRVVSEGLIPNGVNEYKHLSRKTAQARREKWFPALIDRTREIENYAWWNSPNEAFQERANAYRRDRTEGQPWSIYLGVEKHGMTVQLMQWFGDLGLPILALGGYSSQTFVDEVAVHIEAQDRQSLLLYAGDFDASGIDIDRDFEERTDMFDKVIRIGLTKKHLAEYNLPPMLGKIKDSRSASFIAKHGELVQVELDALPPEILKKLYQKEISAHFKKLPYKKCLAREKLERDRLQEVVKYVDLSDLELSEKLVSRLSKTSAQEIMDICVDKTIT